MPCGIILTRLRTQTLRKHTSMASLLSLPPELLVRISKFVEPTDLKNLRRTCKVLEPAANPRLGHIFFADRRHVLATKSIKDLESMVSHPYFGPFVRTIAFNCVRKAFPDAPVEEDSAESVPPFQISSQETKEEVEWKKVQIGNIIKKIHDNHKKISIGVFFENIHDEQRCDGLKDGTIDISTGGKPEYSMMVLRDTLRSLLQICSERDCSVYKISIDLGSKAGACFQMAQSWDSSVTVFNDIRHALADQDSSLEFKYGADDSRYKTFSYDHSRKTLTMFNSSMDQNGSAPQMKRLFGTISALATWLGSSEIETLDLTGAGNRTTSAPSLQNIFFTPCHISLKHLRLKRMRVSSISTWNLVMSLISQFPAIQTCDLSNLTSFEMSADRVQRANFMQVFYFKADGHELKKKLVDLAAQLQAHETAWRAEALDSPTKWMLNLGPKLDSRIEKKEPATSTPEVQHEIDTGTVLSPTLPEPAAAESLPPASIALENITPGANIHESISTPQVEILLAGTDGVSEETFHGMHSLEVLRDHHPNEQVSEGPDISENQAEPHEDLENTMSTN